MAIKYQRFNKLSLLNVSIDDFTKRYIIISQKIYLTFKIIIYGLTTSRCPLLIISVHIPDSVFGDEPGIIISKNNN